LGSVLFSKTKQVTKLLVLTKQQQLYVKLVSNVLSLTAAFKLASSVTAFAEQAFLHA
jgi:hypothetical protein